MSKQVQYHNSEHSNYRRRLRSTREPFSFPLPIFAFRKGIDRQELNERLNNLLYSDGPAKLEIEDLNWYLIGEFNGPYEMRSEERRVGKSIGYGSRRMFRKVRVLGQSSV